MLIILIDFNERMFICNNKGEISTLFLKCKNKLHIKI